MAIFPLTTGLDTFVGGPEDDTVDATAATLNPGDSLTGGTGNNVLALYGSGIFHVDELTVFTGFENITLNNFTNDSAYLYLSNQPISVTTYGSGESSVFLGSGAITFQGGSGYNLIYSTAASNWNAANVIDGGFYGALYLNSNNAADATYDLTANTFAHINYLDGYGQNLILKLNSAVTSAISHFYYGSSNGQLTTSDATLDLSHSSVIGFKVASTNASGTTFTVEDASTAFQIAGGPGQDTIVANGFAFTAEQRNAIFATASVEKIVDASGAYAAPTISINVIAGDDVLNATEAQQPLAITGTSTGAVGQTVTVGLNGAKYTGTVASDGTWSATVPQSALLSSVLPDGSYTVSADVSNQYGNAAREATQSVTVHETPPTITIDLIAGDDVLNVTEAQQPLAITGTSTGVVGQTVTVGLNGAQYTGTVASDGNWSVTVPQSALLSSVLPDGRYTVTADVSDQYGNAAQEATQNLTVQVGSVIDPSKLILAATVQTLGEYDNAGLITWNGQPLSATNQPTAEQGSA